VGIGFIHLSTQEKYAYKIILKAFESLAVSFDSSRIDRRVDVLKIINVVLGDHPSIVYFDKSQITTVSSGSNRQVQLVGCLSKPQIRKLNSDIETIVDLIIAPLHQSSQFAKLIKIYKHLQANVKYDMDSFNGLTNNPSAHNAYGALVNRLAVCDGFSSAFALLAQRIGFDCTVISGHSTHRSTGHGEHAWNIIKVNNKYYHMDVTWDANHYQDIGYNSYEYFALSDEEIMNDHQWGNNVAPVCLHTDLSYYVQNNVYANDVDHLNEIIKAAVRQNKDVIRFKLSKDISYPNDTGDYLSKIVLNAKTKLWKSARITYTWNESTRCFWCRLT
jgi:acid phosphatase family membrane protein YuiD